MRFGSEQRNSDVRNSIPRTSRAGHGKVDTRGFTLIEMVVVISMILVLLSIALPMYNQSIVRAKEAKLHQNLATLNDVIEKFSLDKGHAPQSLDDLVQAGYLKFIPEDITGRTDSWKTDAEDPQNAWDPNQTGIAGVHSGSDEASSDGSAYSSWSH
ncbi:MAG: type II secretion system protein [Terriglobales bacterium]|jgi:general secretion pathway protein G